MYFENNQRVLRSIAAQLEGTDLQKRQQERILRNHALDFPEFREITIFDENKAAVVSSRVTKPSLAVPAAMIAGADAAYIAPPTLDADHLPRTTMAVKTEGPPRTYIVAELSLETL